MIEEDIIRAETYKKLTLLRRQYSKLPHREFICDGAENVWSLQIKLIEKILQRFSSYTQIHLQLINATLIPFFERICGYLDDSKTSNVPWSIIPSLEELFSKIRPNTKFVICPLWETNYKIYNRNLIEIVTEKLLLVPGLIFDPNRDIGDKCKEFLKDYPTGIYFVFYPRTERLSVLHFPLLGHEIGHIYSLVWLNDNFKKLLTDNKIEELLKTEIQASIPPNAPIDPLFLDDVIELRLREIIEIYRKVLAETISDLVGTFIFGPSALFSSYFFALKFGLEDFKGLTDGYLPWRFRIYFIAYAMKYMGIENLPSRHIKACEWINNIYDAVKMDLRSYSYTDQLKFIRHIVNAINSSFNSICDSISQFLNDEKYTSNFNEADQKEAYERLKNGVIPNCTIDKDLFEKPISLRNIVAGTWICLSEINIENYEKYYLESMNANMLSLKAIELSHFQKDFCQRTRK